MSRLSRYAQKLFGSTAGANQIAKFGSFEAGTPARYSGATVTPDLIQALSNYLAGWNSAVAAGNSPTIEDMNALCYLFSYQNAYMFQAGVPEWDASTTYYTGSIVQDGSGNLYTSIINSNTNNALTDATKWNVQNARPVSATPILGGRLQTASSGSFSSSSVTYTAVTNLSGTLPTTGQKSAFIGLMPDPGASVETPGITIATNDIIFIEFLSGVTVIASFTEQNRSTAGSLVITPGRFWCHSQPDAANTAYSVKMRSGGGTQLITNCVLTAYEF